MQTEVTSTPRTLPRRYYTDPQIFAEEMDRFYSQMWVYAGRESEIPLPGDFVLREIAVRSDGLSARTDEVMWTVSKKLDSYVADVEAHAGQEDRVRLVGRLEHLTLGIDLPIRVLHRRERLGTLPPVELF